MKDFRQHDDIMIDLRLTDRRGRRVRACEVEDLKIRVWTQNPNEYIGIYPRDIREDGERDYILIPDYEMAVLSPGVVVYCYSFRETSKEEHEDRGHCRHDYEKKETVITEIRWCGMHRDPMPKNPVNAHSLEAVKRELEERTGHLERQLSRQRERLGNLSEDVSDYQMKKNEADTDQNEKIKALEDKVADIPEPVAVSLSTIRNWFR